MRNDQWCPLTQLHALYMPVYATYHDERRGNSSAVVARDGQSIVSHKKKPDRDAKMGSTGALKRADVRPI